MRWGIFPVLFYYPPPPLKLSFSSVHVAPGRFLMRPRVFPELQEMITRSRGGQESPPVKANGSRP